MLRRVAEALHARVRVVFELDANEAGLRVAEGGSEYGVEKYAMRFHQHEMV